MHKQKKVLIQLALAMGATVGAGGSGRSFMIEPYSEAEGEAPGSYPVKVRFNGDPAREITYTDARPRAVDGGFTKVEIVNDREHNRNRHFLCTTLELDGDTVEAGHQGGAMRRDPTLGSVPVVVSAYMFGGQIYEDSRRESGVPGMAEDPNEHPKVLKVNDDGRLLVESSEFPRDAGYGMPSLAVNMGSDAPEVLRTNDFGHLMVEVQRTNHRYSANISFSDPGKSTWLSDGTHYIHSQGDQHTTTKASAYPFELFMARAVELVVCGGVAARSGGTPTLRVYLEWLAYELPNAPVIESLEVAPNLLTTPGNVGIIQLGQGLSSFSSANITTRGCLPSYCRIRYETTNAVTSGLRFFLAWST